MKIAQVEAAAARGPEAMLQLMEKHVQEDPVSFIKHCVDLSFYTWTAESMPRAPTLSRFASLMCRTCLCQALTIPLRTFTESSVRHAQVTSLFCCAPYFTSQLRREREEAGARGGDDPAIPPSCGPGLVHVVRSPPDVVAPPNDWVWHTTCWTTKPFSVE
jgi:hypothetical protein